MTNTSSEKTTVNSPTNLSDHDLLALNQNPAYQNLADKSAVVGISEDGKPVIDVGRMVFKTTETSSSVEKYKTFTCELTAFLKDSNAYGNVYFSRYFEWQGVCREKFWVECICSQFAGIGILLATKKASIEYLQEVFPLQTIKAELNTKNLRSASVDLEIIFKNPDSGTLFSRGSQTIVFLDQSKKIMRIPDNIKLILSQYLIR
ncbi:MAG: acyl-CoA thioesterase [Bacteriovoracia bacterium]